MEVCEEVLRVKPLALQQRWELASLSRGCRASWGENKEQLIQSL